MRKATLLMVVGVIVAALALAACGGGASQAPAGGAADAAAGKALFAQTVIGTNPGCVTCHSLEAGKTLVGPSMAGIAGRAGSTVSGQSAEQYLKQSLTEPDAYLVKGFAKGLMVKPTLTDKQVSDLVAYMLTLK
ncbi:MAG: L-cysteine S-thiosulfotransferase [Chloroflexota bacterium]|nr:L-cysteine S-thiosulfotransferase [Chloroflexota bacterium]